jgi:propanediol dehydratase large subunit
MAAIVSSMRHPVRDTRLAIVAAADALRTASDEAATTVRVARVALFAVMIAAIGVLLWLTK